MRVVKGNGRAYSMGRRSTKRFLMFSSSHVTRGALISLLVVVVALNVLPANAGAVSTVTTGTTVTDTYSYTGSTETLTVPANVYQLSVTVTGAEGGRGGRDASGTAPPGGYQGVVTGTITVTPGEVLTIGVGQGGADSPDWNVCTGGANQPTGDPNDAVGGTNPIGGYGGGAGGAPGPSGCSGYGGSGGAASVVEFGTAGTPTSLATIVAGGSGGSGGSGQYPPTLGQISLPTFMARTDATSTSGEDGESVYTACHQVTNEGCDGGGGAGGGGGAQGGSAGFVEFGSGTSDEWFGLGGYPGENSTGGLSGLSSQYNYYGDDNANGSVVISYSSGSPSAPTNVNGSPANASVSLYWSAPSSLGSTGLSGYVVQYAASPYSSWSTASSCTGTTTSCVVGSLTNGTPYEFEVAAVNSVGQGSFSSPSGPLTPTGPPGAPTITALTPFDGSLSVAFGAASSSLAILDYQYSLDGGTTWVSGGVTSSPLTISGLTNGTTYSVLLRAVSAAGDGAASAPAGGTPSALPGAPTITSITPGGDGTSLGVAFVAGYAGGSSITSYQYATSIGAGTSNFGSWTTATGTSSPLTITGLSNGTTYSVELRAVNGDGSGPASVYVVGATLTVPGAPTITSLTPGDSTIQVTYSSYSSANDGGSAISEVDYSLDGGTTWINAGTLANPFTISSLTNGTLYNVMLRADNGVGDSPASSSSPATPRALPGAPTQVDASGGATSAQVSWNVPTSTGGAPILSYSASAYNAATGGSAVASCASSTLSCTISGLSNDTTYYFDVSATNVAGTGPTSSPRVSTMPVALPGAPTISALGAGNSYLAVTYSAGTFDTNDPITGYQYSTDGGATWQTPLSSTSPITISGLTDGISYTVELRATSASGAGAASNSEVGTPYAAPDATANATTSYVAGSGEVTVSWLAPNDNGAAIASYTVTAFTAAVGGSQQATCTTTTLSCELSGLSNGTTYYISIQSVNVYSEYSLRSSPLIPVVSGSASAVSLAANPTSSTYGTSVTLTATLTSGATGSVNFESGGATIGSCGAVTIVSSSAQCATTALPAGTDSLQAYYSGNSTYASSLSSTDNFVVAATNQSALSITTVSTTFAESPSNDVTLATSGGSSGGAVSYVVSPTGNTANCSVSGATLSYASGGTCSLTATMAGGANYNAVSSSATVFTVNRATSSTTLGANPTSSTYGTSVTLTATLTSGATGSINFESGGTTIGSCGAVTIVSSSAQCATTALSGGTASLQAVYSGDGNFLSSFSSTRTFDVSQASQPTVTVTSIIGTIGHDLTLAASGGAGTGSVTYVVASGTSTCTQPTPGVVHAAGAGTCLVTATKASDLNYLVASSSSTTVTFSESQSLEFTSTAPVHAVTGSTYTPIATSSAALAVTISVDPASTAVCSMNGSLVTFLIVGTCLLDANQAGAGNVLSAPQIQQSVTVFVAVHSGVPSAPFDVATTSSAAGVVVSWTVPASDGGSAITGYVVSAEPGESTCSTSGATSCVLTGLSTGTTYTISVVAENRLGNSTAGSTTYELDSTAPSAPRDVAVTAQNGDVFVSWNAPVSNGGEVIIGYDVTVSGSNAHCSTTGATSCTVSGLKDGVTYTFSVVALTTAGPSTPGTSAPTTLLAIQRVALTTHFAFGSYALSKHVRTALRAFARRVVLSKVHALTLLGYTDDVGSVTYNDVLSRERATAVGEFLKAQFRRMAYDNLTMHEIGKGVLTIASNRALDRIATIVG
jgi:outer membrane protein OmpA-like peptidoglycan-associated protein/predicted RNA-binding protein with TRAM domain